MSSPFQYDLANGLCLFQLDMNYWMLVHLQDLIKHNGHNSSYSDYEIELNMYSMKDGLLYTGLQWCIIYIVHLIYNPKNEA